eukprot:973524-Pyramimonas_sp.AAC.1
MKDIKAEGQSVDVIVDLLDALSAQENLICKDDLLPQLKHVKCILHASVAEVEDLVSAMRLLGVQGVADGTFEAVAADQREVDSDDLPALLRLVSEHPCGDCIILHAAGELNRRRREYELTEGLRQCKAEVDDLVDNPPSGPAHVTDEWGQRISKAFKTLEHLSSVAQKCDATDSTTQLKDLVGVFGVMTSAVVC